MFFSAVLAIPTLNPVAFNLDGMVEAQMRIKKERINATVETFTGGGILKTSQILDVDRGGEARLQFQPDALKPFVEVYYYKVGSGSSLACAYRPESGQYTQSGGQETNLPALVKSATPVVDDFIVGLLIPEGMAALRDRLDPTMKGWQYSVKSGLITLSLKKNNTSSVVVLNQSTLRPVKLNFANPGSAILWNFSYAPYKTIKPPSKERNAYLVAQFDALLASASTNSGAAKSGLEALYSCYDQPNSLGYTVTNDNETTKVFFSKAYVYQSDTLADWKFDGSTLTLYNKATNKLYQGKATQEEVIAAVASTGSRIETGLRSLIIGRNPYRLMLNSFSKVSSKGKTTASEPAEILFASSPFADMKITVAQKDGFVLKIESTPKTQSGEKLPTSISSFKRSAGENTKVSSPASATQGNLSELLR
jgi:hypothetical protein